MSDNYEFENNAIDGEDEMGSLNHSIVQSNLCGLLKFKCNKKLIVMSELSIDISQYDLSRYKLGTKDEIRPDVCAYENISIIPDKNDDLIKVSQIPDLVIEILSPRQAIGYLIRKIDAYLELGVKSCWLVIPINKYIAVYSQFDQYKSFDLNKTEVIDEVMSIQMPIANVFAF